MEFFLIPHLVLFSLVLHVGSQVQDANICTIDGPKKMCVQQMVIALRGDAVTLPCQFTYEGALPIKQRKLIISRHQAQHDVVLYNSDTKYQKEEFKNRLQPLGNTNEGNGSVKITDVRVEDEGTYTFRFEYYELKWGVMWNYVAFQTRVGKGTTLQVHVRPNIRRIWKEFDNSGRPSVLKCEAEAKPEPNISWLNPQGQLVNAVDLLNHSEPPNGLITKISSLNIMGEGQDGVYICMVENKYAKVQKHLIIEESEKNNITRFSNKSKLWFIVGGVAAVITPLVLLLIVFKWRCQSSREGSVARAEAVIQELGDDGANTYLTAGKDQCQESDIPLYETLQIESIAMPPVPPSAESETNVSQTV